MSRRDGFDLSRLINEYKEGKDQENALKKVNDAKNKEIKEYMTLNKLESVSSDKYTVILSTKNNESLNEELAIEIIKDHLGGALLNSVIKKKEYIDEDALEKMVYNGDFDPKVLTKAKYIKSVTTLRVTKKKEEN